MDTDGQPLALNQKVKAYEESTIESGFFSKAPVHVQEDYICRDILRVLGV